MSFTTFREIRITGKAGKDLGDWKIQLTSNGELQINKTIVTPKQVGVYGYAYIFDLYYDAFVENNQDYSDKAKDLIYNLTFNTFAELIFTNKIN